MSESKKKKQERNKKVLHILELFIDPSYIYEPLLNSVVLTVSV